MCFGVQLPIECKDQGCSLIFIENQWCLWQHDEEGSTSIVTCYVSNCLAMMSSNACERGASDW